jgi:hypothetical protein
MANRIADHRCLRATAHEQRRQFREERGTRSVHCHRMRSLRRAAYGNACHERPQAAVQLVCTRVARFKCQKNLACRVKSLRESPHRFIHHYQFR